MEMFPEADVQPTVGLSSPCRSAFLDAGVASTTHLPLVVYIEKTV